MKSDITPTGDLGIVPESYAEDLALQNWLNQPRDTDGKVIVYLSGAQVELVVRTIDQDAKDAAS